MGLKKGEKFMKILGWIFVIFIFAGLGYAACYYGWVEELLEMIA